MKKTIRTLKWVLLIELLGIFAFEVYMTAKKLGL
jgi:hypothetical protein